MSMLSFGQAPSSNSMSVEKVVEIKKIIFKLAQGETLTEDETTTYNTYREEGKKSRGGQGGPSGMQGGPSGMQGGPGMMQGGPGMMQGGPGMMQGGQGMQGGPSAEKLKQVFTEADKDGDGTLSESEFKAACDALKPKN